MPHFAFDLDDLVYASTDVVSQCYGLSLCASTFVGSIGGLFLLEVEF